jgi:polysaccharide pyruvyl transferase WcaK-like protein
MRRVTKAPKQVCVNNVENSHYEVKGVLGQVGMLYAMRLHALILASASHTPIAGIAYQPKCRFYLDVLGLPTRILDFNDYSPAQLAEHILSAWRDRADIRSQLDKIIPSLQQQAYKPARLIAALDRGLDIGQAWDSIQG